MSTLDWTWDAATETWYLTVWVAKDSTDVKRRTTPAYRGMVRMQSGRYHGDLFLIGDDPGDFKDLAAAKSAVEQAYLQSVLEGKA